MLLFKSGIMIEKHYNSIQNGIFPRYLKIILLHISVLNFLLNNIKPIILYS